MSSTTPIMLAKQLQFDIPNRGLICTRSLSRLVNRSRKTRMLNIYASYVRI
jgi:hypothetical protein